MYRRARPPISSSSPRNGCRTSTLATLAAHISGFGAATSHDHVFLNHTVGKTWNGLGVRRSVSDPYGNEDVKRACLGVVHVHHPKAVLVENARIKQLVLHVELAPAGVLLPEPLIRKGTLRIVVAPSVPGVAGQGVEVPPDTP